MKYLGKSDQGVHPSRVHALIYLLFERLVCYVDVDMENAIPVIVEIRKTVRLDKL